MTLSYSQNLEDHHLALAFAGRERGIYVDIGGGHPVADNVTYSLYLKGWSGVVVEPQDDLARLYRRIRPRDRVVSTLVGRHEGRAAFHIVDRLHGFSTMVAAHAESAAAFGAGYTSRETPVTTLAALCEAHGLAEIDVLKIDVEGAEADVIAGGDWSRFRPKVVLAEAITPGTGEPAWQAWEPALLGHGYDFALFDGLNRFYVAREQPQIAARLPRDKADWGVVTHLYEVERADSPRHPDHALARDLARGLWASLPDLDPLLLARLILRGRSTAAPGEDAVRALAATLYSDRARESLGRIACGYDGGQIVDA